MKIHMIQKRMLFGNGWTRCGKSRKMYRTNIWKRVTCKQCLKIKKMMR